MQKVLHYVNHVNLCDIKWITSISVTYNLFSLSYVLTQLKSCFCQSVSQTGSLAFLSYQLVSTSSFHQYSFVYFFHRLLQLISTKLGMKNHQFKLPLRCKQNSWWVTVVHFGEISWNMSKIIKCFLLIIFFNFHWNTQFHIGLVKVTQSRS